MLLRATRRCLRAGPAAGDKDRERLYRERQRQIMYDEKGNLRFAGWCYVMWEEFQGPLLCVGGGLLFTYLYQTLVVKACEMEAEGAIALDRQSEQIARESGKLKADRYLTKPRRQIDDPDMYNIPSHSGSGKEFRSKLFSDDSYGKGNQEEFSRHK